MSSELLFSAAARVALQNRNRRPIWTTVSLPAIIGGYAMRPFQFVGKDLDGQILYYHIGGTLPVGVTISPSGVMSGTPPPHTTATKYTFVVRILDNSGAYVDRSFTIDVVPALDISPTTFQFTGSWDVWVAPVSAILTIDAKGAGGGSGGTDGAYQGGIGEAGARRIITLPVTRGDNLRFRIGGTGGRGGDGASAQGGGAGTAGWPDGTSGSSRHSWGAGFGGGGGSTRVDFNGSTVVLASGGYGGVGGTYLGYEAIQLLRGVGGAYPNGTLGAGSPSGQNGSLTITW